MPRTVQTRAVWRLVWLVLATTVGSLAACRERSPTESSALAKGKPMAVIIDCSVNPDYPGCECVINPSVCNDTTPTRSLTCLAADGTAVPVRGQRIECTVTSRDSVWEVFDWIATPDHLAEAPDSASVSGPVGGPFAAGATRSWGGPLVTETSIRAILRHLDPGGAWSLPDTLRTIVRPRARTLRSIIAIDSPTIRRDTLVSKMKEWPFLDVTDPSDSLTIAGFEPLGAALVYKLVLAAAAPIDSGPNKGLRWTREVSVPSTVYILPALNGSRFAKATTWWNEQRLNRRLIHDVAEFGLPPTRACGQDSITLFVRDYLYRHEGVTAVGPSHRQIWNDAFAGQGTVTDDEQVVSRKLDPVLARFTNIYLDATTNPDFNRQHAEFDANDRPFPWMRTNLGCVTDFFQPDTNP